MFWLILTVIAWGIIHSIMASLGFKTLLRQTLGNRFMRFYRLFYNIFSVISFAPILYLVVALPDRDLYQTPSPWSSLMLTGQVLSIVLLIVAVLQTDILSFVGFRQLLEEEKPGKLVTKGFYRYMRHPLYTFGLLIIWLSSNVTLNSLVVYLGLTVYIFVGVYFEERKLLHEFGQEYVDYKSATPMIVPGLKLGGNK
ncbi:MAG TPA: isoprenylcysteine carboxylmethyltransferase family protein [Anaerolineales bacterium]